MKKLLFLFLILIIVFQLVHAQAPNPNFIDKMALSEAGNHQKSATFTESDDFMAFDLIYQRLNFTIDPAVNQIAGSVFSLVKIMKDNVNLIRFDMVVTMVVDSVKCNEKVIAFRHSSDKIEITLPILMQKYSISSIEIFYHGSPPQTGFGSFSVSKHNNIPVIWTLSEPYGSKDWWPCKESLADKIDSLDVYITCPSQYKAASNGKLISDIISGKKCTAHWKHRFPIATYLIGVAVTNYETYSDFLDLPNGNKIEVLNYIYPEYLEIAKTKSTEILSILQFYNSKFITYPFASEKYGHAQFGWDGGMEHQTMSFMNTLDFDLVAHEMAHQWFGDYITLASWHDIWLNEGFATYLTGLTYENLLNGKFWSVWKDIVTKEITSSSGGSVYVADTTDVYRIFNGRLSYSKGAYLLHMLRWEMGDEMFFKGMKNYLNDPSVANGFASQEKFVKHMEIAADTSFTEFFKDWYYGEGFPTYQMVYFPDPSNPNKQKLRINQIPSHSSVGFFEMHIPLRIWEGGKSQDLRLFNTYQNQEFDISEGKLDSIQFDPDKWLCAKVEKISAVREIAKFEQIQIIPDYFTNRVRIILTDFLGNEALRIFDLNGRIVQSGLLIAKDSWVEIKEQRKAIYVVEVHSEGQRKTMKVLLSPRQAE